MQSSFDERVAKNPSYSLRAFSRDLGLAPSQISQLLSGGHGLSPKLATKIAEALQLEAAEENYLQDLVSMLHARSFSQREASKGRVLAACRGLRREIDLDTFLNISDWCHLALRELCALPEFREDPDWMARRLGLESQTARDAWARLVRLGLVVRSKDGGWEPQDSVTTPSDQQHAAGKIFHTQMLEKAQTALHEQELLARDFSALVLAFSSEQMPEAKKMIRDFRRGFEPLLKEGRRSPADSVYGLTIQLFRLDSREGEKTHEHEMS